MKALRKSLDELNQLIDQDKSIYNPVSIIKDIEEYCTTSVEDDDIGMCSSILFDKNSGICAWIDKSLRNFRNDKDMINARKEGFELVAKYIEKAREKIEEHVIYIKDSCLNIFRREDSQMVKKTTFEPMLNILSLDLNMIKGSSGANALNIIDMFEIYMKDYTRGKSAKMVKGNDLHMLGVLAEHYPADVCHFENQLLNIYIETLEEQSRKTAPDSIIIAKCFKGLAHFFTSFRPQHPSKGEHVEEEEEEEEEDDHMRDGTITKQRDPKKVIQMIYNYMNKALTITDATRHDVPKDALYLLSRHASLFKDYLTEDAERIFKRLTRLCSHRNTDVRKIGFVALNAFLSVVSGELVNMESRRIIERNQSTFTTLINRFKLLINNGVSGSPYYIPISIHAFGYFAAPMKLFLGENQVKAILMRLFKYAEQVIEREEADQEENVHHLPSFLSAFATIILELDTVENWIMEYLEKLMGTLMVAMPKQGLFPSFRYKVYVCMIKIFIACYLKDDRLTDLLDRLLMKCMILAISSTDILKKTLETQSDTPLKLYETYFRIWKNLLNPKLITTQEWGYPWNTLNFNEKHRENMQGMLYDNILKVCMHIIEKLDLRIEHQGEVMADDYVPQDITAGATAKNQKDYELFHNMVAFLQLFITKGKPTHFPRWVDTFTRFLINQSLKHPYVSGFYRLISACMENCIKFNYFQGISASTLVDDGLDTKQLKTKCFHRIYTFVTDLIERLNEFKGELLAACITLFLTIPEEFIEPETYTVPLKMALEIGVSYLPIAKTALNALEHWLRVIPSKHIRRILPDILPQLNEYLLVSSNKTDKNKRSALNQFSLTNSYLTKGHIGPITYKNDRKDVENLTDSMFDEATKMELRDVQLRILRVLGRFGGTNEVLLTSLEENSNAIMSWDTEDRIHFKLPFRDMKASFAFDDVLPRTVHLALTAGHRPTKIAACEMLHSIMLYMIGKNAYSPLIRQRAKDGESVSNEATPFYRLYKKLFPVILKLAVDNDLVAKQLFYPLSHQMTHWFTQNMKYENKETMALLDAIITGLCDPQNGALKDLCAELIAEFFKWSIKHDKSGDYANVNSLLQRLYSRALHPNKYKRMGAMLAFSKMYRQFREVDALVKQHALYMTYVCIVSLNLSDKEEKSILQQTCRVIQSLEKIIIYRVELLVEKNEERQVIHSLEDLVSFLFATCGSVNVHQREQAMKLFLNLVVQLDGYDGVDGPKHWLYAAVETHSIKKLIIHNGERLSIQPEVSLNKKNPAFRFTEYLQYLAELQGAFDFYHWILVTRLLMPHQMFPKERSKRKRNESILVQDRTTLDGSNTQSTLFDLIEEFVMHYMKTPTTLEMNPSQHEQFLEQRGETIMALVQLLSILVSKHLDFFTKQVKLLEKDQLYHYLAIMILHPSLMGLNTANVKVQTRFMKQLNTIFTSLEKYRAYSKLLRLAIRQLIATYSSINIESFDIYSTMMDVDNIIYMTRGYRVLHKLNLYESETGAALTTAIAEGSTTVFQKFLEKNLKPSQVLIAREFLLLYIDMGLPVSVVIKQLMDETDIERQDVLSERTSSIEMHELYTEQRRKKPTKGEIFYKLFKKELVQFLAAHYEQVIPTLMQQVVKDSRLFRLLLDIVQYKKKKSGTDHKAFYKVVLKRIPTLLDEFATMERFFQEYLIELCNMLLEDTRTHDNQLFQVCDLYIKHINNRSLDSDLKYQLIQHVPRIQVITQNNASFEALTQLISNDFPLNPNDLQENSDEMHAHMALLRAVLFALRTCHNAKIISALMPLFKWDNHPAIHEIDGALVQMFSQLDNEQLYDAATLCMDIFQDADLPKSMRSNAISRICLVCLEKAPTRVVVDFFCKYIDFICKIIHDAATFDDTLKGELLQIEFMNRICCFELLDAMYRIIPAITIKESINPVYCLGSQITQPSGKELNQLIIRSMINCRTYEPTPNQKAEISSPQLLKYYCSSYNALASAILCTQSQEKFFNGFLFKDKNDLWKRIVNTDQDYHFEVETQFEVNREIVSSLHVKSSQLQQSKRVYLSSNYLADSSLGNTAPYINSFFVVGSKFADDDPSQHDDKMKDIPVENRPQEATQPLEMDIINSNSCMPTIVRVMDKLKSMTPSVEGKENPTMPGWIKSIYGVLNNEHSHPNIKIFLARIIINRYAIFEPWGAYFFEPLAKLAQSNQNGGKGIHYFVRDLCVLFLRSKTMMPTDSESSRGIASGLISHLMQHCANKKKIILTHNLELIKLLVEKWKSKLTISKRVILGWICKDINSPDATLSRSTGLQLMGVLLANDIPVYESSVDAIYIKEEMFLERLLHNVTVPRKRVYEACGEICGMMLHHYSTKVSEEAKRIFTLAESMIAAKLNRFLSNNQLDRFTNVLYKIGLHFGGFIDNFLPNKLIDLVPHLFGSLEEKILEMIVWRSEFAKDLYVYLKPQISTLIKHKNEPIQLLSFQIIFKMLPFIKKEDLDHFLSLMNIYTSSHDLFHSTFSESSRAIYYEILIWIYDNRSELLDPKSTRHLLIQGMTDQSEAIRQKLLQFWDHESRLSNTPTRRLEELFSHMYQTNLGDKWLNYSTFLILQLLHRSPDFSDTSSIFTESLADCEFKEYDVDVSIYSRSLPMTPMFSMSLSGNSVPKLQTQKKDIMSLPEGPGYIASTQAPKFSLTQYSGNVQSLLNNPSLTQTSLLFKPFKNVSQGASSSQSQSTQQESMGFIRRRFKKYSTDEITGTHIRNAVKKKRERQAWYARKRMEQRRKIKLYRRYRSGELPDIKIAIKELILPFQALCLHDVTFAKTAFISLFNSLYEHIKMKMSDDNPMQQMEEDHDDVSFHDALGRTMHQMLDENRSSSALINSILSVLLSNIEISIKQQMHITTQLVVDAALESFNIELGILLCEELIKRSRTVKYHSIQEKNPHDMENEEARRATWITMSKLYKALDEDYIVTSVFEHHTAQKSITKQALNYELTNSYSQALKCYGEALQKWENNYWPDHQEPSGAEVTFWQHEQLECMKSLMMWDDLADSVTNEVCGVPAIHTLDNVWSLEDCDVYLPLLMDSFLKSPSKFGDLRRFIVNAMDDSTRSRTLKRRYSMQLAIFNLLRRNYEEARSYVGTGYDNFISEWSSLSDLSFAGKKQQLQRLQPLLEMEEFLSFLHSKSKSHLFKGLLTKWNKRFPSINYDLSVWDNLVLLRHTLLSSMKDRLGSVKEEDDHMTDEPTPLTPSLNLDPSVDYYKSSLSISDSLNMDMMYSHKESNTSTISMKLVSEAVQLSKISLLLRSARAARKQHMLAVSQSYLKKIQLTWAEIHPDRMIDNFDFYYNLIKLMQVRAQKKQDPQQSIQLYNKIHLFLRSNELNMTKNGTEKARYAFLKAETFHAISERMSDNNIDESSIGDLNSVVDRALQNYKYATTTDRFKNFAKAHRDFARFADYLVVNHKSSFPNSKEELASSVVSSYLKGMNLGQKECRDAFPRVLSYLEQFSSTHQLFKAELGSLKLTDVLPWVSQMLPHFNGDEGEVLLPILEQLCKLYPQVLYYPMQLSREGLKPKSEHIKLALDRLLRSVKTDELTSFVHSLNNLTHPEHRWKDWWEAMKIPFKEGDTAAVKQVWKECFDDLFDVQRPHQGAYNKRFAQLWAPHMKKDFGGREGTKLGQYTSKSFDDKCRKNLEKMKNTKKALRAGKIKLNYFSTYLADYHGSGELLIPSDGSDGNNAPVTVVGFDPTLLVMGSIRRPKRLIMYGNDEREYPWLVKGGEDLRQDARIEQLFRLMNDILSHDVHSCRRKLHLKMYKVIPMSTKVGLIEWVNNTKPLKLILEEQLSRLDTSTSSSEINLLNLAPTSFHTRMLQRVDRNVSMVHQYLKAFQKCNRTVVSDVLAKQYASLPGDLLKQGILQLAASSEAFLTLRSRFARSLAAFNICSYILGIGDRHLENFLLDYQTGSVVGIDFGHAFGTATDSLPVPELVPFRLTRQLLEVFTPLTTSPEHILLNEKHRPRVLRQLSNIDSQLASQSGEDEPPRTGFDLETVCSGGILFDNMVCTMSSLNAHRDELVNCMEVFVKEPLVDWLKVAHQEASTSSKSKSMRDDDDDDEEDVSSLWYPDQKLALARRKLSCFNPVSIFLTDIERNRTVRPVLKYIKPVIHGDPRYNIRARLPDTVLPSVRDQVACLVDMATDPNILGRTYVGFAAWF